MLAPGRVGPLRRTEFRLGAALGWHRPRRIKHVVHIMAVVCLRREFVDLRPAFHTASDLGIDAAIDATSTLAGAASDFGRDLARTLLLDRVLCLTTSESIYLVITIETSRHHSMLHLLHVGRL